MLIQGRGDKKCHAQLGGYGRPRINRKLIAQWSPNVCLDTRRSWSEGSAGAWIC